VSDSIHCELYGHIVPSLIDGFVVALPADINGGLDPEPYSPIGPALFLAEQAHCLHLTSSIVTLNEQAGPTRQNSFDRLRLAEDGGFRGFSSSRRRLTGLLAGS
jgi:hypothetical protein